MKKDPQTSTLQSNEKGECILTLINFTTIKTNYHYR